MSASSESSLARRAAACKAFRPMDGMLWRSVQGITWARGTVLHRGARGGWYVASYRRYYVLPDLSDPATLGCLLALVREAWACRPEPCGPLAAFTVNGHWGVGCMSGGTFVAAVLPAFATEAEALVTALEAAP